MFFYKLFSHLSTTIPRTSLLSAQRIPQQQFHNFSNQFHSLLIEKSFSKIDTSSDSAEVMKLLKTLLEGVEMTEKQLSEAGYLLHDRVIRPAEVGVTQAKEDNNPAE